MDLAAKKELVKVFEVEASFYHVEIGTKQFECRSFAEIRRIGFGSNRYDAVFILCNPGSCRPEDKDAILAIDPRKEDSPFLKARSDETQRQIMRLMQLKQWDQVVIINLSDLCAGNLTAFRLVLGDAENTGFHYHSIFSKERAEKLQAVLERNDGPFIAGWGTNAIIKMMAKAILQDKRISTLLGWKYATSPYYYHPSPQLAEKKKEWLRMMNEQIG